MIKAIKIFFGIIVTLLLAVIILPIIFQDKIVTILKEKINENINAKVEFADANLSLIKNFPNASVTLNDISIVNYPPFEGDTLFYGKNINLKLSVKDVIKGDNINIKGITIDNAKVNVITNENGQANYDIAKKSTEKKTETPTSESSQKSLAIEKYEITNSELNYIDQKGKMIAKLKSFNHSGTGDFSADRTELNTKTSTEVFFKQGKQTFVEDLHLDLNAVLDLDLKNQKYAFLKNEAHINQLPLTFDGFVELLGKKQNVNIHFKTPSSDFKNFLALVPKAYAKNISEVQTTGNFSIDGTVNGVVDEKHIPKIDINITSNNASFKFPSLPKGVENIQLKTNIKNNTGLVESTFVDIQNISFKIDENTFNAKAIINRLTSNPIVDATVKGKLNLADIDKVYPLEIKNKLSGIIDADLNTKFDAEALQKSIPERIKNKGKLSLNQFAYTSEELANPLSIKNAEVDFKPTTISLTNFEAKTGSTDLKAKGTINDLLGFVLSDKKLKGNFNLTSNNFKVTDFMQKTDYPVKKSEEETKPTSKEGALKIPSFLDITTSVNAKKVLYDNLELSNVKGTLLLKDQKATLKEVDAGMFDGRIGLNGTVNTKENTPVFDMKMGIKDFNIGKSVTSMKLLESLAPIASVFNGQFNTTINLNGALKDDLSPDLKSIGGSAFAQVLAQQLNPEKSKVMNLLNNKLNFIDLKKLNLNDIKTKLSFKNGKVNVQPFKIKYKDIDINIGGSHGFDQSMNYNITFDVPAKYLGTDITNLLSKLDAKNKNMIVPVSASLTGNFSNPSIQTDIKSAVSNLTTQLIEQQKQKAINKVSDKVSTTITDQIFGKSKKDSVTTKNEKIKKGIKNILGGLLNKKK